MVDLAADELKVDPAELRRRNYVAPNQMPFKTGLTFTYDCGEFEKNMDLALELAEVKGFKQRRDESRKRGKLRGFGISNTIERAAAGEQIELSTTALRDRRGWLGARRGSVSYHILTQAMGPVLAYPPEWARALRNAKRRKPF
jgi:CO/xanthine dehydrogenase Mo-binding subunit